MIALVRILAPPGAANGAGELNSLPEPSGFAGDGPRRPRPGDGEKVSTVPSLLRILALCVALPTSAVAQTVVGTVLEAETNRPLGGAFVVLEDTTGARQAAVLADSAGRYLIRAPRPGRYRLLGQLIGYADTRTSVLDVPAGATVRHDLRVPVRAISLDGIRAEVGQRCHRSVRGGAETARLWEEARKALEITHWTERREVLHYRITEHRGELDAASLRVLDLEETVRRGIFDRSPYRSIPAARLAAEGYVQWSSADGHWDYYGPDAAVLLSDSFLDTHCFRVHPESDEERVGLAFEPVAGRDVPEIEGVLWLDRATAELETLDFHYTELPFPHDHWPQVGGHVAFERLATGTWIVRSWHIRMPKKLERRRSVTGDYGGLTLRTVHEVGARILEVRTADGRTLSEARGATLHGVVESEAGAGAKPVAGARIALPATGHATRSTDDGVYRLQGLPAGTFTVRASHPALERLGGEPFAADVTLTEGRARRLPIRLDLASLARASCRASGSTPADPVIVAGTVRAPDSTAAVPGAIVRVFTDRGERRVVADSSGSYALCIEHPRRLELGATGPGTVFSPPASLDLVRLPEPSGVLVEADLYIDPRGVRPPTRPEPTPGADRSWVNAMMGTVLDDDGRSPVAGALVVVRRSDGTPVQSMVTDPDGRFVFPHPDGTTTEWRLSVEHIAYGRIEQTVRFAPAEEVRIEILLQQRAIELAPITVTERRRGPLARAGFYGRRTEGYGHFIDREEIERKAPGKITDLLRGRSGVHVVHMGNGLYDIRTLQSRGFQGPCQPAVWVDGLLVRPAGPPRYFGKGDGPRIPSADQLSELVPPDEIEGIEVYPSSAGLPVQYGGTHAGCGVVLIWTR